MLAKGQLDKSYQQNLRHTADRIPFCNGAWTGRRIFTVRDCALKVREIRVTRAEEHRV